MTRTHGTTLERKEREEPENRFILEPEDRTELELRRKVGQKLRVRIKVEREIGIRWKHRDYRVKLHSMEELVEHIRGINSTV